METAIHVRAIALDWLERFSDVVRRRDYDAGYVLFAPHVTAFGSVRRVMHGIDTLCQQQWRAVWDETRGYTFDIENVVADGTDDLIWIAATWHGEGMGSDGSRFPRSGRVTFVLQQFGARWLAVHSHHSRDPDGKL